MLWSAAGCAFELWNVELSGGATSFESAVCGLPVTC